MLLKNKISRFFIFHIAFLLKSRASASELLDAFKLSVPIKLVNFCSF